MVVLGLVFKVRLAEVPEHMVVLPLIATVGNAFTVRVNSSKVAGQLPDGSLVVALKTTGPLVVVGVKVGLSISVLLNEPVPD
jgi:hypothetical protein